MNRFPARCSIILATMLALAACGGQPAPEDPDTGASADPVEQSVSSAPREGVAPESRDPAPDGRFSSRYTDLDLDDCELVSQQTEGEGSTWRCPGLGDMALVVMSGDGRMDLDAGADNGAWESIGAFNAEPGTVEWRMADGVPLAIIYRLRDVTPQGNGKTVLMVETVGEDGCLVGRVAGDTPQANARARTIADEAADGFACGTDEPEAVGDAT